MSRVRFVLVLTFLYIAYRWISSDSPDSQVVADLSTFQLHPQTPTPNSPSLFRSFLSLIWSIISGSFSFLVSILAFIWSIIGSIWTVAVIILNIGYIIVSYWIGKRNNNVTLAAFFIAFLALIIAPIIVNSLLSTSVLAFNLFLPIYLTEFVDVLGDDRMMYITLVRNLVFFTIVCSAL